MTGRTRRAPAASKPKVTAATLALAEAKLAESGLTLADADLLHIGLCDDLLTLNPAYEAVPGLVLRYMHPMTGGPFEWWAGAPPYERVRKLAEVPSHFGETKKARAKYMQPKGTRACAYFPTNHPWAETLLDPNVALYLTEGELKAAKACKEGLPTIGLGGVDSYKALKSGFEFLPELELVAWAGRTVYICYDSDTQTNPSVARAVNMLAEKLMARGAFPHYVVMPDVYDDPERKTGLDDYLVAEGPEAFVDHCVATGVLITLVKSLWQLNEQVLYVRNPGLMIDRRSGDKFTVEAFKGHRFSERTAISKVINNNGEVSYHEVPAPAHWLGWPLRAAVDRLDYLPGLAPLAAVEHQDRQVWNTWTGWGCEPREGDVEPFLQLLGHLFTGAPAADLTWFLQWLAYPLQYPGTKLFTSVLLWGPAHGTGKSLVGYTMKRIYGKNFNELNQKDLYKDFNGWAENRQFVMGDDITGTDKQHESDILKKFITQETIRLNIKHLPEYEITDVINYYFTANGPVALFLEDDDRRSFVHEVTVGPLDEMVYLEYKLWLDTTGPAALFHYLLHEVDVSGFNPGAPARKTDAKRRMIADGRSDLGEWVAKLKEDPDAVLRMGEMPVPGDLMTNKQLLMMYDPLEKTKVTGNGLGRELRKRGFQYALGGASIKTPLNHDRYYVVRNRERWLQASAAEVRAHLTAIERPIKESKF